MKRTARPRLRSPGKDTITVNAFVYNGRKDVPAKEFEDRIENNTKDDLSKKLLWTSEPYKIKTIRWMAHEDESGSLLDWTDVNGQYEREFTQQASGKLVWKSEQTMANAYSQGREAARRMTNNKSDYDKAVFATDRELQGMTIRSSRAIISIRPGSIPLRWRR